MLAWIKRMMVYRMVHSEVYFSMQNIICDGPILQWIWGRGSNIILDDDCIRGRSCYCGVDTVSIWITFTFLVTGRVHDNKVLADALLNSSTFLICFTDLLCLTNAPLPIYPNSKVDRHTLHLKLCLLLGCANNYDSNRGSVFQFKLKLVYFIINLT